MRTSYLTALALLLAAGCGKADRTSDSAAGTVVNTPPATTPGPAAPAAPTIALANLAGKWTMVATPTDGPNKTPTTTTLTATADTAGWTHMMAGGKPVALHVRVDGDSIITSSGPYESFRRKGTMVTTNGVLRVQQGKLVGTTVAHYAGGKAGADSVLHLNIEATRVP
jgi:hypothetical protein